MGFPDLNKQNLAKSWGPPPKSPERQRNLISGQKLAGSSSADLGFGKKFGLWNLGFSFPCVCTHVWVQVHACVTRTWRSEELPRAPSTFCLREDVSLPGTASALGLSGICLQSRHRPHSSHVLPPPHFLYGCLRTQFRSSVSTLPTEPTPQFWKSELLTGVLGRFNARASLKTLLNMIQIIKSLL